MSIFEPDPEDTRPIAVLDFEATCLPMPGSWPIEVAIVHAETGAIHEWLIRPPETAVWDPNAIKETGLTNEFVQANGLPPAQVAAELAAAVAGHNVLSDAVGADGFWLHVLCGAGGIEPPCRLEPIGPVLDELTSSGGLAGQAEIEAALDAAMALFPVRHRAGPDAARWAHCLRVLTGLA